MLLEKQLSIIVPAYNEEAFIEKCLSALNNQTVSRKSYEIIVSDSSSTDSTVEVAKSLADKVVTCRKQSAGFGRNFGAKFASAEKLAFIDADTIACSEWAEGALKALDSFAAATGPFSIVEKNSFIDSLFYKWWDFQTRISVVANFPLFPGFNIAVRKQYFSKIVGFREDNMTCEDLDFSLRMRKIGKIGYSDRMIVTTSSRRLKHIGHAKYIWNAVSHVFFNKSAGWEKHRADF